jgi:ATP-dependent Clp protease ATP-binding subunit ClpA
MRFSVSIELVMHLATQEAGAAGFREIEPEHLLESILKLSELAASEIGRIVPDDIAAKEVESDAAFVRSELEERAIESTRARRALRQELGRGEAEYRGGRLRRSGATREIFEAAGKLADRAGNSTLSASHLLKALLVSPTKSISRVMRIPHEPGLNAPIGTPLLDKYGKVLRDVMVAAGVTNELRAEYKALVQTLCLKSPRSVLLVSDNDHLVSSVVLACAHSAELANRKKSIVDLTSLESDRSELAQHLNQALIEARGRPGIILFLPAITDREKDNRGKELAGLIRTSLSKGTIQCIFRVASVAYEKLIKKDVRWKRLAEIIWTREGNTAGIPLEL